MKLRWRRFVALARSPPPSARDTLHRAWLRRRHGGLTLVPCSGAGIGARGKWRRSHLRREDGGGMGGGAGLSEARPFGRALLQKSESRVSASTRLPGEPTAERRLREPPRLTASCWIKGGALSADVLTSVCVCVPRMPKPNGLLRYLSRADRSRRGREGRAFERIRPPDVNAFGVGLHARARLARGRAAATAPTPRCATTSAPRTRCGWASRAIKGAREEGDAPPRRPAAARATTSVRDLWLRTDLPPATLERLAEADAFAALGLVAPGRAVGR